MENEQYILVENFCTYYNVEFSFIQSLTEFGFLEITIIEQKQYVSKEKLKDLEKMIRLHYDLNINMEGIDAISHLLQKIHNLQKELSELKNSLG